MLGLVRVRRSGAQLLRMWPLLVIGSVSTSCVAEIGDGGITGSATTKGDDVIVVGDEETVRVRVRVPSPTHTLESHGVFLDGAPLTVGQWLVTTPGRKCLTLRSYGSSRVGSIVQVRCREMVVGESWDVELAVLRPTWDNEPFAVDLGPRAFPLTVEGEASEGEQGSFAWQFNGRGWGKVLFAGEYTLSYNLPYLFDDETFTLEPGQHLELELEVEDERGTIRIQPDPDDRPYSNLAGHCMYGRHYVVHHDGVERQGVPVVPHPTDSRRNPEGVLSFVRFAMEEEPPELSFRAFPLAEAGGTYLVYMNGSRRNITVEGGAITNVRTKRISVHPIQVGGQQVSGNFSLFERVDDAWRSLDVYNIYNANACTSHFPYGQPRSVAGGTSRGLDVLDGTYGVELLYRTPVGGQQRVVPLRCDPEPSSSCEECTQGSDDCPPTG